MKRWLAIIGMVALTASVAWAQPRQGGPPGGSPGGGPQTPPSAAMQRQQHQQMEMATRSEQAMNRMRELDRWMAEHATRSEWRETNRAMEQAMERLRAMDERVGKLAGEPEFRNDRARLHEMDRLQDRFRASAREMEECHEGIRRMVQEQRAQGAPAASGDRDRLRDRQKDLTQRMETLEGRARELQTWMNANRTRGEWTATAGDMDQIRDRLRTMLHQTDRLCEDPDMDRERLRDMDRLQDRLHVMTREIDEAYDALSGLVRGE